MLTNSVAVACTLFNGCHPSVVQLLLSAMRLPQVPTASVQQARSLVSQQAALLLSEYGHLEKSLAVRATAHESSDAVPALEPVGAERLLTLLLTLPHGVLKKSHAVQGRCCSGNFQSWMGTLHIMRAASQTSFVTCIVAGVAERG